MQETTKELETNMTEDIQKPWGEVLEAFEKMGLKVTVENESFFKMGFVAAYKLLKGNVA